MVSVGDVAPVVSDVIAFFRGTPPLATRAGFAVEAIKKPVFTTAA